MEQQIERVEKENSSSVCYIVNSKFAMLTKFVTFALPIIGQTTANYVVQ